MQIQATKETLPYKLPELLNGMMSGKVYDLDIKIHREKRSNDANAFLWCLLGKMASALKTSNEELYFEALKRYGKSFLVKVRNSQLEEAMCEFKYAEPFEQWSDPKGETAYIKVYRGSSTYDTKEFSRLLDGVIDEARELGIDTDPEEVKQLMKKWQPIWAEKGKNE